MVEIAEAVVVQNRIENLRQSTSKGLSDLERQILRRLSVLKEPNTDAIRRVRREFSRTLAKASPELIIQVALRLTRRPGIFYRFFAYELVHYHHDARGSLNGSYLEVIYRFEEPEKT